MKSNPYEKIYHRADKISERGVSALCFAKPQAINLKRALWTLTDSAVMCKKCLKLMAARQQEAA
jgi:hypothetical protein